MSRPLDHPRLCRAHSSRTGARCRKWALHGMTVCSTHGGRAPQNVRAAEQRIARLALGPAITALERALKCGEWGAVVRAAKDLLDRQERREQTYSPAAVGAMARELVVLALSLARTDDERRRVALTVRRLMQEPMDIAALPAADDDRLVYVDEVIA